VLSALLAVLTFFSNTVVLILDACNITVKGEKLRMIQLVISCIAYLAVYLVCQRIGLAYFFVIQGILLFLLIIGGGYVLNRAEIKVLSNRESTRFEAQQYKKYFWTFSSPLIVYSIAGLITGLGG